MDGATYYKVYYDDLHGSSCRLEPGGESRFCELLADDVSGTIYTHSSPDRNNYYYWVVACNSSGCSDTDRNNPATGWSAAEFMARQYVVDAVQNFGVRVDSGCTAGLRHHLLPRSW